MPLISHIGRSDPKVRLLIGMIYMVLIAGAVTMIYPFLLMVAGSTRSAVDARGIGLVPRFLVDDTALYQKHMEGLFNERIDVMRMAYDMDVPSFEAVVPPVRSEEALVDAWLSFAGSGALSPETYTLGYLRARVSKTLPHMLRSFKQEMLDRFDGDVDALNREMDAEFVNWNAFDVRPQNSLPRLGGQGQKAFNLVVDEFKQRQSMAVRYYFMPEGLYKTLFLKTRYTRDIDEYNRQHGTSYTSYDKVRFTRRVPNGTAAERDDWEALVRNTLNLLWVRLDASATPAYQSFLESKYGALKMLNKDYGQDYASWGEVVMPEAQPADGLARSDWDAFVAGWKDPDTGVIHMPSVDKLYVHSVRFMFADHLRALFGSVEAMNRKLGTDLGSFDEVRVPQQAAHYRAFLGQRSALRWEFATRNYRAVVDYMLIHGRGVVNTSIYCLLAVLAALIVNPMAAYAMSRYRLPSTYKLLLFMLVTMAFPPMVTQIPVFLMLRDLNMLNTFAALILPGLAHGYSIFLLKGFFDSLPRELYESAQIDGAGEWTLFWRITMSLSKPILAVIALHAFTAAYANFMFALLLCQDEKMWTMMVWLYQLQQRSGQAVVFASLIIAAIPTFLVFVFCQNIIMRGIVVPVEK